jgi:hypothetical protein
MLQGVQTCTTTCRRCMSQHTAVVPVAILRHTHTHTHTLAPRQHTTRTLRRSQPTPTDGGRRARPCSQPAGVAVQCCLLVSAGPLPWHTHARARSQGCAHTLSVRVQARGAHQPWALAATQHAAFRLVISSAALVNSCPPAGGPAATALAPSADQTAHTDPHTHTQAHTPAHTVSQHTYACPLPRNSTMCMSCTCTPVVPP